jgi:FKBP-type peptidyl-prolyl cis-trans isomerase (trigger factor)
MKHHKITKVEKLPESQVLIVGSIDDTFIREHRERAIKRFQENTEMPGFRKGKVPENLIIERMGEMTVLGDAAEEALNEEYSKIIEAEKLFVLGKPEIKITKLAPGNPLEFTITVAVLPEFKLPDYESIARKEMALEDDDSVTNKEVEDVIEDIRKNFAHAEFHKKGLTHDHAAPEFKPEDLPEVTDDFVKKIGDFKDVTDFKSKIKENLKKEKQVRNREKKRMSVLEKTMEKTEIVVPKVLLENELEKMLAQFKDDLARAGAIYEDYLKYIKKTEEQIKTEWKETALKKAKAQLIINKISEDKKISPDADKVRTETEKIMILHPDADPLRARMYVGQMLLNEAVLEFLESQK